MGTEKETKSYIELYDLAKKTKVAEASLEEIRFIPRSGERIFIPVHGQKDWASYTVAAVEYFLGYDESSGEPSRSLSTGFGRVTLYVEASK